MEEITSVTEKSVTQCERVLGENGRLTTAIPGFVPRDAQMKLAVAIHHAIQNQSTLVAEAGTGTGKTFAYLIPCLLSGKKALISTATKTLQDQLFNKDLPILIRALGLSVRVQNLKGRANYICQYRTRLHAEEGQFTSQQCVHEVLHIRNKLPQLTQGERSELPEISEDSPVWPFVTSTTDNCLGAECAYYKECFLVKARQRALDAEVVVTNHHLYFADSRLKQDGFGEILPGVDAVIFDEAHQLPEIASTFFGERISTRQLSDIMGDMKREWPVVDLSTIPFQKESAQLDRLIDRLLDALPSREDRISWESMTKNSSFISLVDKLLALMEQMLDAFEEENLEGQTGLKKCRTRLEELNKLLTMFKQAKSDQIRWLERFKRTLVFHTTPFDIAKAFHSFISTRDCAYIFTSATLTMASSFDCFNRALGLEDVETLLLPSPFDFQQQTLLYLPRSLPDPREQYYYESLLTKVRPVIEACLGRCFFLFTSHKALKRMAELLKNQLDFPLLIQGEEAKSILLARFRESGNAVLLGTSTFWEGVDVKGEALSCVIIDKLPFASPADPVMRGKMAYLKSRGLSSFDELSLPNAVLALKQGVGRLIRDAEDRGLLMIADPRLTAREYGRDVFKSLPKMSKTRDEQTVLAFINRGFINETVSH